MANNEINDWEDVSDSINDWEDVPVSADSSSDLLSIPRAAVRSAAEGLTFGFADEIWGGVRGIVDDISQVASGKEMPKAKFDSMGRVSNLDEINKSVNYEKFRDESRKSYADLQEKNPITTTIGDVGGSIATAWVPGLGWANTQKGATAGARIGQAALGGAATGLGRSEEESLSGMAIDTAIGAGLGATLQGGGEVIQKGVGKIGNRIKSKEAMKLADYLAAKTDEKRLLDSDNYKRMGLDDLADEVFEKVESYPDLIPQWTKEFQENKLSLTDRMLGKVGNALADVDEDITQRYLKKSDEINADQSTLGSVKNLVDDEIVKTSSAVNEAKEKLAEAKLRVRQVGQKMSDQIADERYETSINLTAAKEQFADEWRQAVDTLNRKSATDVREKILQGMDELKAKISYASGESIGILEKEAKKNPALKVDLKSQISQLDEGIQKLQVSGVAVSDSANNSLRVMQNVAERLKSIKSGELTLVDAKRIIQQLDEDDIFSMEKGSFQPEADRLKQALRRNLDDQLKSLSPYYKEKMAKVASDTQLLSEMSRGYGTESAAFGKMQALSSEKGRALELPKLKRFQEATGIKFQSELDEYLKVRNILDSDVELNRLKNSMPSAKKVEVLKNRQQELANPEIKRDIEIAVENSNALKEMDLAAVAKENQERELKNFGSWSPPSSEAKLRQLMQNRNNIENQKVLQYISKKIGVDLDSSLQNIKVKEAFESSGANGSRRTLLGTVIGSGLGSVGGAAVGSVWGAEGAGGGAQAGALLGFGADKYAAPIFKKMLDGRIVSKNLVSKFGAKAQPYAKALIEAQARGNSALAQTHFILSQKHPEYQQMYSEIEDGK